MEKWFYAWFELLLYFPLPLAVGAFLFRHGSPFLWIASLPFVYLAAILCYGLLNMRRAALHLMAAAIIGGAIVTLSVGWHDRTGYILLGIYIVCWFRGIACANTGWERPLPDLHYFIGFTLYFIAWFMFHRYRELEHYEVFLTPTGILAIAASFFYMNYVNLRDITLSSSDKPSLPASILRMNRRLTAGIVGLIVIFAGIKYVRDGLTWLFKTIYGTILALYHWFLSLSFGQGSDVPPGKMEGDASLIGQGTSPSMWDFLEKIVLYIASVVAALVLIWFIAAVLYKLIRLSIRLLLVFTGWRDSRLRDAVPVDGFSDERESLVQFDQWGADYASRLRQWIAALLAKEPSWRELPDATAKARYLYRHWVLDHMRRGYRFKRHLTPSETGGELLPRDTAARRLPADEVVRLYNEARYADRVSDPAALERIRALMQRSDDAGPGESGGGGGGA
jgi:hypothetical protein